MRASFQQGSYVIADASGNSFTDRSPASMIALVQIVSLNYATGNLCLEEFQTILPEMNHDIKRFKTIYMTSPHNGKGSTFRNSGRQQVWKNELSESPLSRELSPRHAATARTNTKGRISTLQISWDVPKTLFGVAYGVLRLNLRDKRYRRSKDG